jgi:predicted phage terminase large subunit-like protein
VFLPQKAAWLPDLESELLSFPNAAHDDQVDATSLAFNVLTKQTVKLGVLK